MANLKIIASNTDVPEDRVGDDTASSLVGWVMSRVKSWEDHRNQNHKKKWGEYYRLWRGLYDPADKSRDSERSKLITPALSQAIEAVVSEIEEASFGQGKWFDVSDDAMDESPEDIGMFRDQMAEDLDKAKVPASIAEIFLNAAIYGTGIGKLVVEDIVDKVIVANPIRDSQITSPGVKEISTVQVGVVPVLPLEFVIDPSAKEIDEALGCAHIFTVPKHTVQKKQQDGIYREVTLSGYTDTIVGDRNLSDKPELKAVRDEDKTMLVEYHGLIPRSLLPLTEEEEASTVSLFTDGKTEQYIDETDLVEAIVTIANGIDLLKAVENPLMMGDRCFVAYQHDTVPNRFWGRGIGEKGYSPQKALDSELRGRIDAMALSIHPMMGIDATRIPRGGSFKIAPGRNVFTNGDPSTILRPFSFGQVNNNTFAQSGELERMVQMGTGAMDSATPLGENRRNETSSGMSMIMGGSLKRSKRTLANIERGFMKPLIHKTAWRYIQFAPSRYPAMDIKFNVHSSLGMMARELEQQQLANMLNTVPPESPAFWMLLKAIYEHSTISNREEMLGVIDQMMQASLQKQQQPEQPDPLIVIKQQELQLKAKMEQANFQMEQQENATDAQFKLKELQLDYDELQLKREDMILDAKIKLSEMEQDSAVTIAQMSQKDASEQRKAGYQGGNGEKVIPSPITSYIQALSDSPAVSPAANLSNSKPVPKKKRISVVRTDKGFEGRLEEVGKNADALKRKISVVRTDKGFEGEIDNDEG